MIEKITPKASKRWWKYELSRYLKSAYENGDISIKEYSEDLQFFLEKLDTLFTDDEVFSYDEIAPRINMSI